MDITSLLGTSSNIQATNSTLKQQLEQDFGPSADNVFKTDGTVDVKKLDQLLKTSGAASSQRSASSSSSSSAFSTGPGFDPQQFLTQFSQAFGKDAAASVENQDGTVNFQKVKSFIDQKIASFDPSQSSGAGQSGGVAHHGHHHHHHASSSSVASSDDSSSSQDSPTASLLSILDSSNTTPAPASAAGVSGDSASSDSSILGNILDSSNAANAYNKVGGAATDIAKLLLSGSGAGALLSFSV